MNTVLRKMRTSWLTLVTLGLLLASLAFPLAALAQQATPQAAQAAPADPLEGFGAGTTGGAGGPTINVSTLSALESAVSGSSAKIVQITGPISGDTDVKVGSNTTILGIGTAAVLKGIDLDLDAVSNVIIRNVTITFVLASDTTGDDIHIIDGTNHVWVDHNEFYDDRNHGKDYYDGQVDITRASDYITVSWNRFHDHYKSSLVGHSDSNGSQDTGHLHVTYAHNWFYNVGSRTPSLRFGTGHVYNNYFQNITDDAIHSRMGAQMLIQNNVFRGVATPVTTTGDSSQDGYANISGNDFGGATPTITQVGSFTTAPYSFTLDPTANVLSEVSTYSGVGIISGSSTGGGSTPTPTPTSTPVHTPTPTTTPTSTPVHTPTPTTTPTSTPTSGSSCSVNYVVQNQWSTGFTTSITITNTGSTAINGWALVFTFPGNQQVTQGWNGTFSQQGNQVTASNASYNAAIATGGSVAFGFNGTWSGTNTNPTSFTLNGMKCS